MSMKSVGPYLIAIGTAVALSGFGYAQSTEYGQATRPAAQAATADRGAMMAAMQAEQTKLDDMVAQMNAATGPDKVDRVAAVVTEMVAMHKRMMQGAMMQMHMQHGQMPGSPSNASPADRP